MSDNIDSTQQEGLAAVENHREDQAYKYYNNALKCSNMMYQHNKTDIKQVLTHH